MMIETLAEHYSLLPSEVISRATTFDMFVFDAAQSYRKRLQDQAEGKIAPQAEYTQQDLMKILEANRVKSK